MQEEHEGLPSKRRRAAAPAAREASRRKPHGNVKKEMKTR